MIFPSPMSAKVTSIALVKQRTETVEQGQIGSPVVVPFSQDSKRQIFEAVRSEGLKDDLQNIWAAYPNLEDATSKLLSRLSISWPSQEDSAKSAVALATIKAIRAVKRGIDAGERSRAQVVAAYLSGLATVAEDVAAVRVWGCHGAKSQERWSLEDSDLAEWVERKGFDEVKFFSVDQPNQTEVAGTRMKLLCAIATTRDVGLLGRYH